MKIIKNSLCYDEHCNAEYNIRQMYPIKKNSYIVCGLINNEIVWIHNKQHRTLQSAVKTLTYWIKDNRYLISKKYYPELILKICDWNTKEYYNIKGEKI